MNIKMFFFTPVEEPFWSAKNMLALAPFACAVCIVGFVIYYLYKVRVQYKWDIIEDDVKMLLDELEKIDEELARAYWVTHQMDKDTREYTRVEILYLEILSFQAIAHNLLSIMASYSSEETTRQRSRKLYDRFVENTEKRREARATRGWM